MGFAVYHVEKGNSNSGGIGNHIDRVLGMEHSYLHADPSRRYLNIHFQLHEKSNEISLHEAIEKRISEGYKSKKAIRKDAVKYCTHILTGSHKEMKDIFLDQKKSKEWIHENYNFIKNEFGRENIVRFTLHMDEKTPHIHAVTVPLTEDGRLSAKDIIGNKEKMKGFQNRYATAMSKFGLERGIENTGIKHENAQNYYSRISNAEKDVFLSVLTAEKNIFGNYREESVKKIESALISSNLVLKEKEYILKKIEEGLKYSSQAKKIAEKKESIALEKNKALRIAILKQENDFKNVIRDPKLTEQMRVILIEKETVIKEQKNISKGKGFSR